MSNLSAPHFHDEAAAYAFVEARVWPNGAVCPHCGGTDRNRLMGGKSTRIGTYKCYDCRKPFTVKVGTIFEASKVGMTVWLQAIYLMASSKKGISTHQLHRTLGVALRTAWFMSHRIREAMREGSLDVFGSGGGIVEADETFIGNDRTIKPKGQKKGRGYHHKHKVLALVDRSSRRARTMVVDSLGAADLAPILRENIAKEARLMTDEASYYTKVGREFASHDIVRHGQGEYGRGEIGTNTIEGFFSIFKRGMKGVYQHCGKKHLHRYAAEFEFRYNHRVANGFNDLARADQLLTGFKGKRLMYRDSLAA
ncbi:MAG: IS1595 family transposase [Aquamicrobium sp.]|uniref:IS1595 family transposase n=1 Tax=Aquamicrobium sp. TaxID=1872579 RepID=UPI00349EA0FE|nr:IS1595 family transposase [Aquamicrobium sp.]